MQAGSAYARKLLCHRQIYAMHVLHACRKEKARKNGVLQ